MTARNATFPREMAAEMRRRAGAADGAERDYFAWLAAEWDRTAERDGAAAGRAPAAREFVRPDPV